MPRDIARDQVQRLAGQGAAIVEVLPREQFEKEHLPGAISLPLDDFKPENVQQVLGKNHERPFVVYCESTD